MQHEEAGNSRVLPYLSHRFRENRSSKMQSMLRCAVIHAGRYRSRADMRGILPGAEGSPQEQPGPVEHPVHCPPRRGAPREKRAGRRQRWLHITRWQSWPSPSRRLPAPRGCQAQPAGGGVISASVVAMRLSRSHLPDASGELPRPSRPLDRAGTAGTCPVPGRVPGHVPSGDTR